MWYLPVADREPQEFYLKASAEAAYCVNFFYPTGKRHQSANLTHKIYNFNDWCGKIALSTSLSTGHPKTLPSGVFLICGDWAWNGIPSHMTGGPCTLGSLTTLTPDRAQLLKVARFGKIGKNQKIYSAN